MGVFSMFSSSILSIVSALLGIAAGVELNAHLSQSGLHGSITFASAGGFTLVSPRLDTSQSWKWTIRQFPVDYSNLDESRCSETALGPVVHKLDDELELNSTSDNVIIPADKLPLLDLWFRSIHLRSDSGLTACASIIGGGNSSTKVATGRFSGEGGVDGVVNLAWLGGTAANEALIYTRLTHIPPHAPSLHHWGIYTTDILDSDQDKARSDCNSLQVMLLDLTTKLGKVDVGKPSLFRNAGLSHVDIANPLRNYYLVILDDQHSDNFLACAPIIPRPPKLLKAFIKSEGVKGTLVLQQEYDSLTPTKTRLEVEEGTFGSVRLHTLPRLQRGRGPCDGVGSVFNPSSKPLASEAPPPGAETQDKYAVGDLSGKLDFSKGNQWDSFLPLSGPNSAASSTLVLYKNGDEGFEIPWFCTPLISYLSNQPKTKLPVTVAETLYRYPLVGRIIFEEIQGADETMVLVEGLVHADGTSLNTTHEHRWGVHVNPPGADFYNWTARCVSAGPVYNPFKVNLNKSSSWAVGSLSSKLGDLTIAGSKKDIAVSRKLFHVTNLPLTGRHSILGKSLVIFDDHGPKARGERLACSKITSVPRRKAVARDWFGNGAPSNVGGKVEFLQLNERYMTDIELSLEGAYDATNFQIHNNPVLEMLEFPCEEAGVGKSSGHSWPVTSTRPTFNDSSISTFSPNSILARSLVLHSAEGERVACATIERGYSPQEAREIRAIASFHHPLGFASGYVRMTQLISNDGSSSDTVIEVNLRHPGEQDKNVTLRHNWAIYVNPVGVDASVKIINTRCTAAGYIWNPYYTQLADPLNDELYRKECGSDLPLRCYVGDLSGRLGTIDLGNGRSVFSDPNFPLEGKVSAMGKSIVILEKEGGHNKYACANIEPDYDTVKYINLQRPPKFVVSQFLEDIRKVMGIPEWFLSIDSRRTNILHNGGCIQIFLHFKGPYANKLEQDLNHLLMTGKLESPSIAIPGYVFDKKKRPSTVRYKTCSPREPSNKVGFFPSFSTASKRNPSFLLLILFFIPILLKM